jgi:tRNA A37 N6-isopentenylltransferase MiaA
MITIGDQGFCRIDYGPRRRKNEDCEGIPHHKFKGVCVVPSFRAEQSEEEATNRISKISEEKK